MAEHGIVDGWSGKAGLTHDEPAEEERSGGIIWLVVVVDVVMVGDAGQPVAGCGVGAK